MHVQPQDNEVSDEVPAETVSDEPMSALLSILATLLKDNNIEEYISKQPNLEDCSFGQGHNNDEEIDEYFTKEGNMRNNSFDEVNNRPVDLNTANVSF